MKHKIKLPLLLPLAGGIMFSILFWNEKQAVNLVLFSIFLMAILWIRPSYTKNNKTYWTAAAHIWAAIFVVLNQSTLSVITWYISLAIFVAAVHFPRLRSIFTMIMASFGQLVYAPYGLFKKLIGTEFAGYSLRPIFKIFKYIIVPLILMFIFSGLYSLGNPIYSNWMDKLNILISTAFTKLYDFLFKNLSLPRLIHFGFGVLFCTAVLFRAGTQFLENWESGCREQLLRRPIKSSQLNLWTALIDSIAKAVKTRKMILKTKYVIGVLCLASLNLLLLFLNGIDLVGITMEDIGNRHLSSELHSGIYALIVSTILAMLIIIYFFSGNLNFYTKNKLLKVLTYIWLGQNMILVSTTLFKDYQYIIHLGLTYKRIGVIVFLTLSAIGLITVYFKVALRKSFFYLYRINGFIWYLILVISPLVNWDVMIASYNLAHRGSVPLDTAYLMQLSDKTLPLLYLNQEALISESGPQKGEILHSNINASIERLKKEQQENSWLSWNYRDWQTYHFINMRGL